MTQSSEVLKVTYLNRGVVSPDMLEKSDGFSRMFGQTFNCKANPVSQMSQNTETDLIWYAAYDQDVDTETFLESFEKLFPDSPPIKSQSCIIRGYQLCFDQALADTPFAKVFIPDSPNTSRCKLLKKDFTQPQSFIYTNLYLITRS